jgi:hypothetical protein
MDPQRPRRKLYLLGLAGIPALVLMLSALVASSAPAAVSYCTASVAKTSTTTASLTVTCNDGIQGLELTANKGGVLENQSGANCSPQPPSSTTHFFCAGNSTPSNTYYAVFNTGPANPCDAPALHFDVKEPGGSGTQAATTSATITGCSAGGGGGGGGGGTVDTVSCNEACTAVGTGTLSVPNVAKVYKLKKVTKYVAAGGKVTLKLKLSKKIRKAAKRALKRHKKVKAKLRVTVKDASGNTAPSKKRTINLKLK